MIAIIPARLASTRLPRKVLLPICGKPMIQHVYERVSEMTDNMIVATGDDEVADVVKSFGGISLITIGKHDSGTSRVIEVINAMNLSDNEWVLNVQGDEPLIDPEDLRRLTTVEGFINVLMGTLMYPLQDGELNDPNVVKVVTDNSGKALYFSRAPIPGQCHIGVYYYNAGFLRRYARLRDTELTRLERLEQLKVLEYGYSIQCVEAKTQTVGVDTQEDLELVEKMLTSRNEHVTM